MAKSLTAAVLGIGTELTTGQVLNRNAHWISARLKELGILTSCHLVVPDDRQLMREALQFCSERSQLLFITGGLGPTTDDFTREIVQEWTGLKTFFHEASWQHIQDRLNSRGIPVREFQKQQCYYPEGAEVLANRNGTANAFCFAKDGIQVFVLPGPPNEIEAVWSDFIGSKLQDLTVDLDPWLTRSWDCLGQGESEIAHLTENTVANSGLEIGYRVHLPYVEVKVSFLKSKEVDFADPLKKLDAALSPYSVLKNGDDAAEVLSRALMNFKDVVVIDELTGAHLHSRLFPFCKKLLEQKKLQFLTKAPAAVDAELVLRLEGLGTTHSRASLRRNQQLHSQTFESPYLKLLMNDRARQYHCEMALLFWMQSLR